MGMHQLVVGNGQELNLLRISEDKSSILSTNHHKAPSYTDLPKYISPKHDVFHHFLLVVNCLYCRVIGMSDTMNIKQWHA